MASMYKDICETDEFLSYIDADQLSNLLSRDDLSAPTESFVFKSVMQWIKYKKEERMAVAAKGIGAVRLGLVDIKEFLEELSTAQGDAKSTRNSSTCFSSSITQPYTFQQLHVCSRESQATFNAPGKNRGLTEYMTRYSRMVFTCLVIFNNIRAMFVMC